MDAKELIESLEKGWPGWLALGFVFFKESKFGERIWGLFVKERERKQDVNNSYEQLAITTVKRVLEASAELPTKLSNLEYLIANQGDMIEELLNAMRSLSMESSVNEKKSNQLIALCEKLDLNINQIKDYIAAFDGKRGKK